MDMDDSIFGIAGLTVSESGINYSERVILDHENYKLQAMHIICLPDTFVCVINQPCGNI
jgi:hypothetical protein